MQATIRQYTRLVKELKPNMDEYEKTKSELGDAFYAGKNTILHGIHKDSPEAVNRMVEDLSKQIDKREKYSRRRRHDDDAEIDYINERNMRFNKKLDRFYGEFTTEIRQNLERGTAIWFRLYLCIPDWFKCGDNKVHFPDFHNWRISVIISYHKTILRSHLHDQNHN